MRDSELAASIVDGDPGAFAEAYDKYADLLWSYCCSLLNDADQAAEAVADTFVIASSRLDVLPSGARLRAWLYAVARCECQRRLRAAKNPAEHGGAERLRHAASELSTGEQRYMRALLTEAFAGLDAEERDIMQMVWHGLDLAEVAAVLGLGRNDAYALFTQARDQLEESVGVLLMGWAGRGGCDEFEDMLYGRDSKLTPELRSRLTRHIAKCGTCADGYRRQMRPSLTLCLSVGALLSEAEDARAVASQAPAGLWEQVYQMTSQTSPESRWHKILGSRRVTFGPDGFPKQIANASGLGTPVKVAAVGAVAVAATATGWAAQSHVATQNDASTSHGVTAVTPNAGVTNTPAAKGGAHAGSPSTKTASAHKPAHAKQQPAGSSPSALPTAASTGTSVPVSTSTPSSATGGSATSGSSTPARSSSSTSSTGSGTSTTTSTSSPAPTTTSSSGSGTSTSTPTPAPTSTNPVTGLVGGVTKTVGGVVGGVVGGL
jgi:RNA polymerase sigma factor (sigma-70 family)